MDKHQHTQKAKCPICGSKLDIVQLAAEKVLTPRQRKIRDAIEPVKRDTQRDTAQAKAIAAYLGIGLRTVQYELQVLLQLEVVYHPSGPKSGWDLKPADIILLRAAA